MDQAVSFARCFGPGHVVPINQSTPSPYDSASLQFRVEPMCNLFLDAAPLFERHYAEVGRNKGQVKLDYDAQAYLQMEADQTARLFMARKNGKVVAYAVFLITYHPRYRNTIWATADMFYVVPEVRGFGSVAMRLFKFVEYAMRLGGVTILHITVKNSVPAAQRLLNHMGYKAIETVMEKLLVEE